MKEMRSKPRKEKMNEEIKEGRVEEGRKLGKQLEQRGEEREIKEKEKKTFY